jgi:oligoribonuclease
MTGLDIENDVIIQIACYVTDYDLNLLENDGYEVVIHQEKATMDKMDNWCTKTHAKSGLTAAVLSSTVTPEAAAAGLLEYVRKYVPKPDRAILAGNSVHHDMAFLRKGPYSPLVAHLHHRILDVSAIKEAARRWCPPHVLKNIPQKKGLHEARQDILESIAEARYYRDVLFKVSDTPESNP